MTTRTELEAIPITVTFDDLLSRAATGIHSRLPVYEDTLDNIIGTLYVRDLFPVFGREPAQFDIQPLLRPVLIVPESKPADDLLEEMRAARQQLAVVIDEYGGTAGIVTLEDLVEALVGRIEAELPVGSEALRKTVHVQPDGSVLLEGLTRLAEFEELVGFRVGEGLHDEVDTLGGLVMMSLGRIPRLGDEVVVAERTIRVERLDRLRVEMVRLLPANLMPSDGSRFERDSR